MGIRAEEVHPGSPVLPSVGRRPVVETTFARNIGGRRQELHHTGGPHAPWRRDRLEVGGGPA